MAVCAFCFAPHRTIDCPQKPRRDDPPDVRTRVETTKRALDLIDEGIALLLRREHAVYDHERDAIMQGRYVACCIADRMASIAYHSLVPVQAEVRDPETPDVQERVGWVDRCSHCFQVKDNIHYGPNNAAICPGCISAKRGEEKT